MVYINVLPNALFGIPSANSRINVENIAAVNDSFAEDPEESIRRRSQQLGLFYGTIWAIFDAGN